MPAATAHEVENGALGARGARAGPLLVPLILLTGGSAEPAKTSRVLLSGIAGISKDIPAFLLFSFKFRYLFPLPFNFLLAVLPLQGYRWLIIQGLECIRLKRFTNKLSHTR